MIHSSFEEISFVIKNSDYKLISKVHDLSESVTEKYEEDGIHIVANVNSTNIPRVKRLVKGLEQE